MENRLLAEADPIPVLFTDDDSGKGEHDPMLDMIAGAEQVPASLLPVLESIIQKTQQLRSRIEEQTERSNKLSGPERHSQGQQITSIVARDMNSYAEAMGSYQSRIDDWTDQIRNRIPNLLLVLSIVDDNSRAKIAKLKDSHEELWDSVLEASSELYYFRITVINLRGITRDLNHASSRVSTILDGIMQSMRHIESYCTEAIDILTDKLDSYDSSE